MIESQYKELRRDCQLESRSPAVEAQLENAFIAANVELVRSHPTRC